MKTTVTITSKRQVTIPKKLWQRLDLEGVRYLEAEIQDGGLRLQKVGFADQLSEFWSKTSALVQGKVDDDSIRRAAHAARRNRSIS